MSRWDHKEQMGIANIPIMMAFLQPLMWAILLVRIQTLNLMLIIMTFIYWILEQLRNQHMIIGMIFVVPVQI